MIATEGDFASPVSNYNSIPPAPKQQLPSYSAHNDSRLGANIRHIQVQNHRGIAQHYPQSVSPPNSSSYQVKKPNQQGHDCAPNLNIGGEHLKLDLLSDPSQRFDRMQVGVNGAQDSPAYQHLPMKHDWGPSMAHDNSTMASRTSPLAPPAQQHQQDEYMGDVPDSLYPSQTPWESVQIPIKHVPATCTIDNLLLSFMHERRQRFAEGITAKEVVGPRYPSVSSLLNPENGSHSHPVSKVFTDILSKFSALCRIPEKVAVLYVMFQISKLPSISSRSIGFRDHGYLVRIMIMF